MIKRIFRLPYLPIWLAPLILFSPLLLTGKALFWGTPALQFVPWWSWAWETLLDGHLPLWNPLVGMGAPLLANYQSALIYPPYWFHFLMYILGGIGLMAWGQALMVVFHLIVAGVGMVKLARRLGLNRLAQTVSGLAFSLSGYLVARAWFASINAAAAWLPWVMYFLLKAVQGDEGFRWGKLGLVIGLQLLAGHAQTTWYTLLLAGLWVAYWGWQRFLEDSPAHSQLGGRWARFKQHALSLLASEFKFAGAVLMGAALAAVQLLPTAVYLSQSQRATAVDYDFAMTYSFWPWRLLGLLAPGLFGSPASGDYWGYASFWEDAVYIGLLPVLLALGILLKAVFVPKRFTERGRSQSDLARSRSFVLFLFVVSLLSLLLALGNNTPVFPWLYRHIPTFSMFQAPTRFTIWLEFALALLAGLGVQIWRRPENKGLYWSRLGTAGAFAVMLGTGLGWYLMRDLNPTFLQATAMAGFWGLGAGTLSLTAPERGRERRVWWGWLVALWVGADLLVAGWGLNPGVDVDFYTEPNETVSEVQEMLGQGRLYMPPGHEYDVKYDQFFRFDTFRPDSMDWQDLRAVILPNLNMLDGIPSVNNFDPLVPGHYARWMEMLEGVDAPTEKQLLDWMGVTVVEKQNPARDLGVSYFAREASSRVKWVPCARFVSDEEQAWERIASGQVDLKTEILLVGPDQPTPEDCSSRAEGRAVLVAESPNQLVIQTESESSGWLVLVDTWYPGWKAWVDGERLSVRRANGVFRALPVGPGEHQVVLRYLPTAFYLGSIVSAFFWSGFLVAILSKGRRRH
jgi:hypothetical protein